MAQDYTAEEILLKILQAKQEMATFYQQDFINYCGKTRDTKEYYTEMVAGWCIENFSLFEQIPKITRRASYKMLTHDGNPRNTCSNRTEELIAMSMFRQGELPVLGKILDYQTPLKNKQSDQAGKIDLLAYDGKVLRILELKEQKSTESMLRCILEGYTYLQIVDKEKLLKDFSLPAYTPVVANPFVFVNGQQYNEMREKRPQIKRLAALFHAQPFYIVKRENEYYDVMEDE